MKQKIKSQLASLTTLLITNPVVVRDLRAQMRGTKSYWYQGAYLLLLGILAIAGYAQATHQYLGYGQQTVNIVDAQGQLQTLYSFIFGTIGVMILLIAPALTAASIVGERQRLSFDLLLTTPLRATELLVGKLVSSIAFLGLLLLLSVPASALCVLLGGATLADVFRVYAMVAIDGVVLAAIGLFFSCASKTNLLAIVWSYASVAVYFVVTLCITCLGTDGNMDQATGPAPLDMAIGALNPIVAITQAAQRMIVFHGVHMPIWIAMLVPAILIVRLLITAATYRLGAYGGESGPSLRKQALLLCAGASFVVADGALSQLDRLGAPSTDAEVGSMLVFAMTIAFIALVAFLPGLFVPVSGEDAPVPSANERDRYNRRGYNIRRAFQPEHAAALPYYHIVMLAVTAGGVLAMVNARGVGSAFHALSSVGVGLAYVSGLGCLMLQIARVAAQISRTASGARGLAFGIFSLISVVPLMAMGLSGVAHWEDSWLAGVYIFSPLLQTGMSDHSTAGWMTDSAAVAAGVCYAIAIGFFLVDRGLTVRRTRKKEAPSGAAASAA